MKHSNFRFFVVALVVVHLFFLVNLKFTAWPEMLAYPYLKTQGYLLYLDMIHPYPPLLTIVLSIWFSVFGFSVSALQHFTWVMLLVNDLLIYTILLVITKNRIIGLLGLASYIALQPFLEGNMLWFDIAITTPILLATFFILKLKPNSRIFLAALFLTGAALIKQTGALFYFGFLAWLIIQRVNLRDLLIALLTPLILLIPLFVRLIMEGAVAGFFNWVVYYPSVFWTKFPGYVQMQLNPRQVLLMLFLIFPLIFVLHKTKKVLEQTFLLLLFLIISLISIYPRFSYFHLQTALPFFALLYPLVIHKLKLKKAIWFWSTGLLLCTFFIIRPVVLSDWGQQARFAEADQLALASEIKQKVAEDKTVYLHGIYASVYVFSDTLPPKPWGDNFGWYYEIPGVQMETIERWEQNPPKHIFLKKSAEGNWFTPGVYQPQLIIDWITKNYQQTEMVTDQISQLEYKE